MALLLLAPDIQEQILFLPRTERGRDPVRLRVEPLDEGTFGHRAMMARNAVKGNREVVRIGSLGFLDSWSGSGDWPCV
jgi:hypothetical protein